MDKKLAKKTIEELEELIEIKLEVLRDCQEVGDEETEEEVLINLRGNKAVLDVAKRAFEESQETARRCGVKEKDILKSLEDINQFFG